MKKILKILGLILILAACSSQGKVKNPATQEHIVRTGNIKGNADVEKYLKIDLRFAIEADKNGMAVFKDPQKPINSSQKNNPTACSNPKRI